MNRLAIAFFALAASLAQPLMADAQTLYTCGVATVRSVRSISENLSDLALDAQPGASSESRLSYVVTVQLEDMVYAGRSDAGVSWNFNPTELASGQAISACANDSMMVLDRGDGSDYRARVVGVTTAPRVETRRFTEGGQIQPWHLSAAEEWRRLDSRP